MPAMPSIPIFATLILKLCLFSLCLCQSLIMIMTAYSIRYSSMLTTHFPAMAMLRIPMPKKPMDSMPMPVLNFVYYHHCCFDYIY